MTAALDFNKLVYCPYGCGVQYKLPNLMKHLRNNTTTNRVHYDQDRHNDLRLRDGWEEEDFFSQPQQMMRRQKRRAKELTVASKQRGSNPNIMELPTRLDAIIRQMPNVRGGLVFFSPDDGENREAFQTMGSSIELVDMSSLREKVMVAYENLVEKMPKTMVEYGLCSGVLGDLVAFGDQISLTPIKDMSINTDEFGCSHGK